MGSLPNRFAEEGLRYLRELERIPTIALAVVFAIVGLTIGKQLSKRYFHFLIVLAAVLVFANAVIAGKGSGFYTLYPMLLILCLVAIGIANCANLGGTAWASLPVLGLIVYGLFLANAAAWSHGPRLLALIFQGKERKYADIFKPLSNALRPGDEVWGSTVAWYAVVRAGARIDSKPEPIPIKWNTHPNPDRHRYVVIESGGSHEFAGFRKVDNFGVELQPVLGSRLSNASYVFELWKSQRLE